MNYTFKFPLNMQAAIKISGEFGIITAASTSTHGEDQYLIHYKAADGTAREGWWYESMIEPA